MNSIALKNDFKTLEIDSTEEIKRKKLKEFVLTSLYINEEESYENKSIYVNYLYLSKKYQLFITTPKFKNFIFEIFEPLCKNSKNVLFISKDFFCIYVNKKFYFYKELEYELTSLKLIEFIKIQLSLEIHETINIENSLDELISSFNEKKMESILIDINEKKDKSLIFFLVYILFLISFSIFYEKYQEAKSFEIYENQKRIELKKLKEKKDEMKFYSFYESFISFKEQLKIKKLKLSYFKFNNKHFEFKISSKNKKDILDFLALYKNRLISSSLKFEERGYVFYGSINSSK